MDDKGGLIGGEGNYCQKGQEDMLESLEFMP